MAYSSQGSFSGANGTWTDYSDSTYPWIGLGSTTLKDDNFATCALGTIGASGGVTEFLRLTNFNFSIPASATIKGVVIRMFKKEAHGTSVIDDWVSLVVEGLTSGDILPDVSQYWHTGGTYIDYGGSGNLWGNALTPAIINGTNFGLAVAAFNTGNTITRNAQIDHVALTTYYTEAAGGGASYMKTSSKYW